MAGERRECELCNDVASCYCPSDAAYLCRSCDSKVHGANFLVARHVRASLCRSCGSLSDERFSGAGDPLSSLCRSCSPEAEKISGGELDCLSSLSSSSCVSSTTEEVTSAAAAKGSGGRRMQPAASPAAADARVEGVLVNWCRRMGLDEGASRRVVPTAAGLLGGMTVLPFRVCLAASFWVALRVTRGGAATCQDLRRVEQISGVPAKLILATEARLSRALKRSSRRSRDDHEEGWAEC